MFHKTTRFVIAVAFLFSLLTPVPGAQAAVLGLPEPGAMVNLSPAYTPVLIKGLKVHPENPFLFDFILDTGRTGLKADDPRLRRESEKLIKYFLATLTIPEKNLWVNLSPYEKDRMVPQELGQTELGRDMLAQDYILKQLTASLIYPEKALGKAFWDRVYAKAQQLYGTAQVPVNTFNKVWITADKANVYVHNNTAFVVGAHLKVMLEEDYLASAKNTVIPANAGIQSQIVREIILPEIEKEVNQGQNFSNLRQIFYSMVLATWYKHNLKAAFLNQVYADKDKVNGVDAADKAVKEKIYQQYLQAYKKGMFNYIKEDVDQAGRQSTPRKYFSGGLMDLAKADVVGPNDQDFAAIASGRKPAVDGNLLTAAVQIQEAPDAAMLSKDVQRAFQNARQETHPLMSAPDIKVMGHYTSDLGQGFAFVVLNREMSSLSISRTLEVGELQANVYEKGSFTVTNPSSMSPAGSNIVLAFFQPTGLKTFLDSVAKSIEIALLAAFRDGRNVDDAMERTIREVSLKKIIRFALSDEYNSFDGIRAAIQFILNGGLSVDKEKGRLRLYSVRPDAKEPPASLEDVVSTLTTFLGLQKEQEPASGGAYEVFVRNPGIDAVTLKNYIVKLLGYYQKRMNDSDFAMLTGPERDSLRLLEGWSVALVRKRSAEIEEQVAHAIQSIQKAQSNPKAVMLLANVERNKAQMELDLKTLKVAEGILSEITDLQEEKPLGREEIWKAIEEVFSLKGKLEEAEKTLVSDYIARKTQLRMVLYRLREKLDVAPLTSVSQDRLKVLVAYIDLVSLYKVSLAEFLGALKEQYLVKWQFNGDGVQYLVMGIEDVLKKGNVKNYGAIAKYMVNKIGFNAGNVLPESAFADAAMITDGVVRAFNGATKKTIAEDDFMKVMWKYEEDGRGYAFVSLKQDMYPADIRQKFGKLNFNIFVQRLDGTRFLSADGAAGTTLFKGIGVIFVFSKSADLDEFMALMTAGQDEAKGSDEAMTVTKGYVQFEGGVQFPLADVHEVIRRFQGTLGNYSESWRKDAKQKSKPVTGLMTGFSGDLNNIDGLLEALTKGIPKEFGFLKKGIERHGDDVRMTWQFGGRMLGQVEDWLAALQQAIISGDGLYVPDKSKNTITIVPDKVAIGENNIDALKTLGGIQKLKVRSMSPYQYEGRAVIANSDDINFRDGGVAVVLDHLSEKYQDWDIKDTKRSGQRAHDKTMGGKFLDDYRRWLETEEKSIEAGLSFPLKDRAMTVNVTFENSPADAKVFAPQAVAEVVRSILLQIEKLSAAGSSADQDKVFYENNAKEQVRDISLGLASETPEYLGFNVSVAGPGQNVRYSIPVSKMLLLKGWLGRQRLHFENMSKASPSVLEGAFYQWRQIDQRLAGILDQLPDSQTFNSFRERIKARVRSFDDIYRKIETGGDSWVRQLLDGHDENIIVPSIKRDISALEGVLAGQQEYENARSELDALKQDLPPDAAMTVPSVGARVKVDLHPAAMIPDDLWKNRDFHADGYTGIRQNYFEGKFLGTFESKFAFIIGWKEYRFDPADIEDISDSPNRELKFVDAAMTVSEAVQGGINGFLAGEKTRFNVTEVNIISQGTKLVPVGGFDLRLDISPESSFEDIAAAFRRVLNKDQVFADRLRAVIEKVLQNNPIRGDHPGIVNVAHQDRFYPSKTSARTVDDLLGIGKAPFADLNPLDRRDTYLLFVVAQMEQDFPSAFAFLRGLDLGKHSAEALIRSMIQRGILPPVLGATTDTLTAEQINTHLARMIPVLLKWGGLDKLLTDRSSVLANLNILNSAAFRGAVEAYHLSDIHQVRVQIKVEMNLDGRIIRIKPPSDKSYSKTGVRGVVSVDLRTLQITGVTFFLSSHLAGNVAGSLREQENILRDLIAGSPAFRRTRVQNEASQETPQWIVRAHGILQQLYPVHVQLIAFLDQIVFALTGHTGDPVNIYDIERQNKAGQWPQHKTLLERLIGMRHAAFDRTGIFLHDWGSAGFQVELQILSNSFSGVKTDLSQLKVMMPELEAAGIEGSMKRRVVSQLESFPDWAMAADINGGIDLNARNMQMDVQGQGIDVHFDQAMIAQFKRGDFSGVRPVILNITPLPSVFPLLGLEGV